MKTILPAVLLACSVASAQAALYQYTVSLSGPNESPPVVSAGTGFGTVDYDDVAHTLTMAVTWTNLTGNVTQSHIHAPTVNPFTATSGIAVTSPSLPGFPTGNTFGSYAQVLNLALTNTYNSTFFNNSGGGTVAGAEAALASAMATGRAYWNIHSSFAPSGEIRGFLVAVPEPSSLTLAGLGLLGFAVRGWARKRGNKF